MQEHQAEPAKRIAQRCLADEFTKLVHGDEGLGIARKATEIFFGGEISALNDAQLGSIFADVPSKELARHHLQDGVPFADLLVESGLSVSKSDARRTIQQGGAYINNRQIKEVETKLGLEHLAGESIMVVRTGKKKYALLRFK
jgi:tyrosyl-tRNA synthetase